MTIPNEKTSASLLCVPVVRKISGAAHRTDWSSGNARLKAGFRSTVARPKSVIRTQPESSTRMFGCMGIRSIVISTWSVITHPFYTPMNHVIGVDVFEATGDVR